MANRRPSEEFDRPLTEEQLSELRQRLAMPHSSSVADAYRRESEESRMDGDKLPRAFSGLGTRSGVEAIPTEYMPASTGTVFISSLSFSG